MSGVSPDDTLRKQERKAAHRIAKQRGIKLSGGGLWGCRSGICVCGVDGSDQDPADGTAIVQQ